MPYVAIAYAKVKNLTTGAIANGYDAELSQDPQGCDLQTREIAGRVAIYIAARNAGCSTVDEVKVLEGEIACQETGLKDAALEFTKRIITISPPLDNR